MNSISRKLEQSLARGPVPRNDLLERETQAREEAVGKYHVEHDLRVKAEHEKKIADEILVVERNRFAQEIRRLETSLAEERQARLQAEQRVNAERLRNDELQSRLSTPSEQPAHIASLEVKVDSLETALAEHRSTFTRQHQSIERLQSIPSESKSWKFTIKRNGYDQMTEVIAEPVVKK